MTSTSEWPTATIKYRLHLPSALHSVSPALSMLHTYQSATLHPEIAPILGSSHCFRCGTYHFSGDNPSQLVGPARKKQRVSKSSHRKALRRTCKICGSSTSPSLPGDSEPTPVHSTSTTSNTGSETSNRVPVASKEMDQKRRPPGEPPGSLTAGTSSSPKAVPRASAPSKTMHTNASTLQEMLARDRHRAETTKARKQIKERNEGLAAFLMDL